MNLQRLAGDGEVVGRAQNGTMKALEQRGRKHISEDNFNMNEGVPMCYRSNVTS